jgi:aspartate aminotransferase
VSPSLTLSVDAKAKALKAEGVDVINFSAGEPDFDTPEHIKAAAMGSLDAGFTKYTHASGIPELRTAISEKLKADNNLDYTADQIVVTCGAKQACFHTFLATLNAGDEVLIPSPYWTSYTEMVKLAGGEPIAIETTAESGYKVTPDQILESMSPLTKMIILNSPGNPTGTVYNENELAALAEVVLDEEMLVLSDEIYEKLIFDGEKHASIASFSKDIYEQTVTINGFSKAYAMTGWRLGYAAAPKRFAKALNSIQSHACSNVTSFAQKGALAALKGPQECIGEMMAEYTKRRKKVCDVLDDNRLVSYVKPMGAFYFLVDISKTRMKSVEFCEKLLEEQKLAVVPGTAFGNDDTVRISFATDMKTLEEGLGRFTKFILG